MAPDHPEVKSCQNDFAAVAADPRVAFLGNVTVGSDVSMELLRENYDAVVLAYGAQVRGPRQRGRARLPVRPSRSLRRPTVASASPAATCTA